MIHLLCCHHFRCLPSVWGGSRCYIYRLFPGSSIFSWTRNSTQWVWNWPQNVSEAPLGGWNTEPLVSWDFAQAPLKADHSHGHPAPNYPVQRNPSPFRFRTGLKCLGVSVSSIYTLCIFTTDQMIRMWVCSGHSGGRNFRWYFYLRKNEFVRRNTPL